MVAGLLEKKLPSPPFPAGKCKKQSSGNQVLENQESRKKITRFDFSIVFFSFSFFLISFFGYPVTCENGRSNDVGLSRHVRFG